MWRLDFATTTFSLFGPTFKQTAGTWSIPKPDSLHHPQPEDGRSMFEDISDGYFECDLQGSITFCNSALSDLLGCSREEMTGIGHHSYLDRADAEIVMRGLRDFLEGALSVPVITYEMTRKDGSRVPVETSLSLIRDREGRVEGFRGIVRDITERVRREEAQKNELKRYIDEINDLYQNVPCGCHSLDENGVVSPGQRHRAGVAGVFPGRGCREEVDRLFDGRRRQDLPRDPSPSSKSGAGSKTWNSTWSTRTERRCPSS